MVVFADFLRRPLKTTFDMTTLSFSARECPSYPFCSFQRDSWYPFLWLVTENFSREVATKDRSSSNPRKGHAPDLKAKVDIWKADVAIAAKKITKHLFTKIIFRNNECVTATKTLCMQLKQTRERPQRYYKNKNFGQDGKCFPKFQEGKKKKAAQRECFLGQVSRRRFGSFARTSRIKNFGQPLETLEK